jgi:hypothetical protein
MDAETGHGRETWRAHASEASLGEEIEHLKEMLLEHDRSLSTRLSRGDKPSLEEKRTRSGIIRRLNRARRELARLRAGKVNEPLRRISFRVSRADYERLQTLADREGMTLSTYIRNQLFPEE